MMSVKRKFASATVITALAAAWIAAVNVSPAESDEFKLDFKGSLAPGKHTRYVPPLANPLFNETPYITTEARPLLIYNEIPGSFLTGGGEIVVGAVEVRVALTERLGFIASKDGYAFLDFDAVLPDEDGFVNISLGFKYAVHSDPADDSILTIGVEYEPPSGNIETAGIDLQGRGDGQIDFFVTGAKAWEKIGLQGSAGVNLAIDGDHDSSMVHYSLHGDYEVAPGLFPLIELNGFTTIDDGTRTAVDFEGIDLVNFGSTDSGTVVLGSIGARWRLNEHIIFGAGYEMPLTGREDITDWRVNFDMVLSY